MASLFINFVCFLLPFSTIRSTDEKKRAPTIDQTNRHINFSRCMCLWASAIDFGNGQILVCWPMKRATQWVFIGKVSNSRTLFFSLKSLIFYFFFQWNYNQSTEERKKSNWGVEMYASILNSFVIQVKLSNCTRWINGFLQNIFADEIGASVKSSKRSNPRRRKRARVLKW